MSVDRITIDTNILVYAADIDSGARHEKALEVLEKAIYCDCILTLQALSEFFFVITRKNILSLNTASERIEEFMEVFPVVSAKQQTLKMAMRVVSLHKISFWDAMLWATAQDAGVTILLSEDFQHQQLINKVRVVNPFIENAHWTL